MTDPVAPPVLLYTAVPADMTCDETLYPLNQLITIHPEVGKHKYEKYKGRSIVTTIRVPSTTAPSWLDNVFFSTCHPHLVYEALKSVGLDPDAHSHGGAGGRQFFAFSWDELQCRVADETSATGLKMSLPPIKTPSQGDDTLEMHPDDWVTLDNEGDLQKLAVTGIPEDTLVHYRHVASTNTMLADGAEPSRPKLWHKLPHVLVGGKVEVKGATIISWEDEPM